MKKLFFIKATNIVAMALIVVLSVWAMQRVKRMCPICQQELKWQRQRLLGKVCVVDYI